MKESGIAVAFEKLGERIAELERENDFKNYRIEDYEKQMAELSKNNALLRAENELLQKQLDDISHNSLKGIKLGAIER